ncbi:MAG: hypothetical protein AAF570_22705 [Bacteroidota bacterium]
MAKNEVFQLVDEDKNVTIQLDGDTANIITGGEGHDGDVILRAHDGSISISLDGSKGNMVLGGAGRDGDIVILDAEARARMIIEGYDASIETKDEAGEITFRIDGVKSDILVRGDVPEPVCTASMLTLRQLEAYFDNNQHLPGMPEPAELEKGVYMKDFMFQLLRRVEALTLQVIELEKKIG